jgi:chemotaxis-related protein WspB
VEVLPLVQVKTLPQAPRGIAGLLNYRGQPVPVVDLSEWALGRPAAERLSTRVILVRLPDASGRPRLLGLQAERATETIRKEPADFAEAGVSNPAARYLGPVATDAQGMVQWIQIDRLLPDAVKAVLFKETVELS